MRPAPLLDPLHIFRIPEVVPISRLAQPAALTSLFAGDAAGRFGTINLVMSIAVIRQEELLATRALTAIGLGKHDPL